MILAILITGISVIIMHQYWIFHVKFPNLREEVRYDIKSKDLEQLRRLDRKNKGTERGEYIHEYRREEIAKELEKRMRKKKLVNEIDLNRVNLRKLSLSQLENLVKTQGE